MAGAKVTGWLALPEGLQYGQLTCSKTIDQISLQSAPTCAPTRYVLPGFIDTHVHGGGGGDTMDGPDGVQALCRFHAQHGTTTLLPTTMTAAWPQVVQALQGVRQVIKLQADSGAGDFAQVLGAHLEGPFISPERLGAQPPHAIAPKLPLVSEVLQIGCVRAVTLAPELPGAYEAARVFASAGVRVGVGHTCADADQTDTFLKAVAPYGRLAATHLFNAMGGIQGRQPGAAGALLTHPEVFPEVIFDCQHVHTVSLRLACAAAPERVMLITDAMRAAGQSEGSSELGGQGVWVREGRATLQDGTLAGSILTMDVALRNAVKAGIPLQVASRMTSAHPARSLGLTDRGELRTAQRADLVVLDEHLRVTDVYIAGRQARKESHD